MQRGIFSGCSASTTAWDWIHGFAENITSCIMPDERSAIQRLRNNMLLSANGAG